MPHFLTVFPLGWEPALGAFIAMFVLHHLWFSPFLFQRSWVRHSGIRPSDLRRADTRRLWILSIVGFATMTVLIGLVAAHTLPKTSSLFATMGAIWVFIMFEQLGTIFARREPVAMFFLSTLRSLATLMLGAFVYYLWSMIGSAAA